MHIETRSGLEPVGITVSALGLELTQFGGILFAAAVETRFLDLQIAELLFVSEEGVELDESGAERIPDGAFDCERGAGVTAITVS